MKQLSKLSTAELQRELARREKSVSKLYARRDGLMTQLREVEAEISALGGTAAPRSVGGGGGGGGARRGGGRGRARNEVSLPDAIAQAMEVGAQVSPKEAAGLVLANGYKTTSANFNMMVSNALAKDKRFKRLGRGQYERIK